MTTVIRPARQSDAAAVVRLLEQLGYPCEEGALRTRIGQLGAHPDEVLLVAEQDGAVCAVLSLHFIPQLALDGAFARISYFCVDEGVQSRGLGAELERHIERLARERGCDRIEVHCHSRRERAHRFYARQGYEESPKYLMKRLV